MADKSWTNLSDALFVLKKKETWLMIAVAVALGLVVGFLA